MGPYTGHVEERGKRGYTSMVIEGKPDPVTKERDRWREKIAVPPGTYKLLKKDAEVKLYARLTDLNRGVAPTRIEAVTLAEHLRNYLEVCKSRDLRDTTITGYKASIDKHIIPAFGKTMLLAELQPSHLQTLLYGKMLADGFASRTIELAHVVLHAALEQAVVEGKLYRNVADAVVPPRPRRKKIHCTLKPEEVEPMLAYMRKADKRMYHFGALCVYTGLSRSEMLAEEWGDIDLPNAVLRVTKGVTVTEKVFTVAGPKTEQRTREVPLLKEALKVLREMKREATCKLLFHEDGHHLNPGTVSKRFTKLAAEAGYPGITPHKLRHTFATNMLRAGVSIKHVQVLMGHSSIKTTGDIYAHVIEDDLRDAVNTYGDSLRKKPSAPIRHQVDSN